MRTQKPKSKASSTLTVRLKTEVKEGLAELSAATDRTRSYLAAEAIEAYVAHEMRIVEAIHRGIQDMKAGRVISHEEAMDRLDAAIERVARRKK